MPSYEISYIKSKLHEEIDFLHGVLDGIIRVKNIQIKISSLLIITAQLTILNDLLNFINSDEQLNHSSKTPQGQTQTNNS